MAIEKVSINHLEFIIMSVDKVYQNKWHIQVWFRFCIQKLSQTGDSGVGICLKNSVVWQRHGLSGANPLNLRLMKI